MGRSRLANWFYPSVILVLIALAVSATWQGVVGIKELVMAVLPLFGTFLGATFAFKLNQDKEERKLHKERREALNRAMFILARQANALLQLKSEYEKFKDSKERAFNLPALKPPSYLDLVHNFVSLEFLLESSNRDILFRLTIEQERFQQALESNNTRSEFYIREYQPKLTTMQPRAKRMQMEELFAYVGERIYDGLLIGTDAAYSQICASVVSIGEIQNELRLAAETIYPEFKFIKYQTV